MVLTFEDNEKELFQNIVDYVNTQVESLQVFNGTRDVQRYGGLEIDIYGGGYRFNKKVSSDLLN